MKRISHISAAAILPVCAACLLPWIAPSAAADDEAVTHPFPGIVCRVESRQSPPQRLFVAEVDLTNPQIRLKVAPGGPDPDGPGQWQTTLMQPTKIAAREDMDLIVNGDFFLARQVKDAEGARSGYLPGIWGAAVGPAVSDGHPWSESTTARPCLVVHKDGSVRIESVAKPGPDARELVSGNTLLVTDGAEVPHADKARHPRTAAGLAGARDSKLVLLVVDGRRPATATGMTLDELAAELLRLGCRQALNLDGGGSSVMALRDPARKEFHILNTPSDGRERAVANAVGVAVLPEPVKTKEPAKP